VAFPFSPSPEGNFTNATIATSKAHPDLKDKRPIHSELQARVKAIDVARNSTPTVNAATSGIDPYHIESWIIDSGAGEDLIPENMASPEMTEMAENTITFTTANGTVANNSCSAKPWKEVHGRWIYFCVEQISAPIHDYTKRGHRIPASSK
jgi:hypothetical protein